MTYGHPNLSYKRLSILYYVRLYPQMCRSTVMSAENGQHDHGDRPSDTNMSFKHYLPSLCSPVVAVADPSENVVDEAQMPVVFS